MVIVRLCRGVVAAEADVVLVVVVVVVVEEQEARRFGWLITLAYPS